jgi:hypothetical protein
MVVAGVAGVAAIAAPAQATVPPKNVGWLYVEGRGGAAFFDADLAGHPGYEKITVCDNKGNNRAVYVRVISDHGETYEVSDPSSDGNCEFIQGNMFPDGYGVEVIVWESGGGIMYPPTSARGVA